MTYEVLLFNSNDSAGSPCDLSSEPVKDLLESAVLKMQKTGSEYADALFQRTWGIMIVKNKAEEKITAPPSLAGAILRAYRGGEWRETGICDLEKSLILSEAEKVSSFTPRVHNPVKLKNYKPWKIDEEIPVKINPEDVPTVEKLEVIRDAYKLASGVDERVNNVQIIYLDSSLEKIFTNTEGSLLRQGYPRTRLLIRTVVREGSKQDYDILSAGGVAGFEIAKDVTQEQIRETVESSLELLKAVKPPSGEFPVILDPELAGMFAHESFGHGCEADQVVRGRSYLNAYLGKRVGPDSLTIYDDGRYKTDDFTGGHGSFLFDDEGIRSRRNIILENGILKGFLHGRYSASAMNSEFTGNGRRENFMRKLFVRMTNTCIAPGNYSLEEMREETTGVELVHGYSGMEDPLAGGIQLKSKKGYWIEKGEKTKVFSKLSLSGNVLEFLRNISAIGRKEYFHTDSGICGKGHEDLVPVGSGGSYIKSKATVSTG